MVQVTVALIAHYVYKTCYLSHFWERWGCFTMFARNHEHDHRFYMCVEDISFDQLTCELYSVVAVLIDMRMGELLFTSLKRECG